MSDTEQSQQSDDSIVDEVEMEAGDEPIVEKTTKRAQKRGREGTEEEPQDAKRTIGASSVDSNQVISAPPIPSVSGNSVSELITPIDGPNQAAKSTTDLPSIEEFIEKMYVDYPENFPLKKHIPIIYDPHSPTTVRKIQQFLLSLSDDDTKSVVRGESSRTCLNSSIGDSEKALSSTVTVCNKFKLDREFVESFRHKELPFGFNGFGLLVYKTHYARMKPDGTSEEWFETVERVTNGTYNMQKEWVEQNNIGWKPHKAQRSAQEFYTRLFELKFVPPGRGLWAMGSPITEVIQAHAALNNCAFVSTAECGKPGYETSRPFVVAMDMLMLGIGVGWDARGTANNIKIHDPSTHATDSGSEVYVIPDSREGWVESVKHLLDSYFVPNSKVVEFDYSLIRVAGLPLKTFGGTSCGSQPLIDLHCSLRKMLGRNHDEPERVLSLTDIADIFNLIAVCVVSGNIRRSAEIGFGENGDEEFMELKNYEKNPARAGHGWASNNSVFCNLGDDYSHSAKLTMEKGEPGYCWLENMRNFSRMNGKPDYKDLKAMGSNPCSEQTLEPWECCCLVEVFPDRHCKNSKDPDANRKDFLRTLKFAYLYAKTVTLGKTHWEETNRVMLRNRRIGCGLTGIAQFVERHKGNLDVVRRWCDEGYETIQRYDKVYSEWLVIPLSKKTTTIKPSGTVSLLAGATPGMHYSWDEYYLRRKRMSKTNPKDCLIVEYMRKRGYFVEDSVTDSASVVVAFPIHAGDGVRAQSKVSMWEQLGLAAFLQEHWSDNQVSCTVTFDKSTEGKDIARALQLFQYQLKSISFLPNSDIGYAQPPYESITKEQYEEFMSRIRPICPKELNDLINGMALSEKSNPVGEKFCNNDSCAL